LSYYYTENAQVRVYTETAFKPHSARTGTVFSQLSAAVVHHKANDGVGYEIRAWFKYDTALTAVV